MWLSTTLSTSYPRTRGTSPDVNLAAARAMAAPRARPRIPVFPRDSAGIQWAGFGVMDSAPVSAAARCFTPPTLYSHTCTQPCAPRTAERKFSAGTDYADVSRETSGAGLDVPRAYLRDDRGDSDDTAAPRRRHAVPIHCWNRAPKNRLLDIWSAHPALHPAPPCRRIRNRVEHHWPPPNTLARGSGPPLGRPGDADATA